jgi:Amino acid kinase family
MVQRPGALHHPGSNLVEGSGQVLKFGGMSVGSGERIRRVASFIGHHVREGEGIVPVIVVSALSGVTDQLLRIARFACTGDHESWQQELEAVQATWDIRSYNCSLELSLHSRCFLTNSCTGYLAHLFGKSHRKSDRACLHWLQKDVRLR